MKSISAHIRPVDLNAQIRMERQKHRGPFLLVEGAHDIRRFIKFFRSESVSFVNCYGKSNVIDTIEIQQNCGHDDCLGFVDRDFDNIMNSECRKDDIIWSNNHDFDIDICATDVIERYLCETGEEAKLAAVGGSATYIEVLLEELKPLSALRYANVRHNLRYRLDRVDIQTFFDGHSFSIESMIEHVSQGAHGTTAAKVALRDRIEQYVAADLDLWQLTNGHDLIEALGIALRSKLGSRKVPQTWRAEVEKHLRLALDVEDFQNMAHPTKIREWEQSRSSGVILKHHLV